MPPYNQADSFGPVQLAPGISKTNAFALMYGAFFTIGLLSYIAVGTPYVLTEILDIPTAKQGTISGNLVVWNEITMLLVFGPVGMAADRIGRKSIYVFGFLTMGLGYALYPIAGSVAELTVYRIIYAAGVATATGILATVVTDYPQEQSRGKLVGIVGFINGLGVVVINRGLSLLPEHFVNSGLDGISAGRYTHWLVAAICMISAMVLGLGLKGGTPLPVRSRTPTKTLWLSAYRHSRTNPRILLSYAAAFIARGDLVILATFLTLWGTIAGVEREIDTAEASKLATLAFITAQGGALVWTLVIIFFIDRFNRVTFLAGCMFLAAVGYLAMILVDDPTQASARPLIILLGVGQISAFFGSQALIGQEAPLAERGAVVAGFNISGAIGILFCSFVGGYLFDAIDPRATFVLVGSINAVVCLLAVLVRLMSPGRMPGEPGSYDKSTLGA